MPEQMLDPKQTAEFAAFSRAMAMAHDGDHRIIEQIKERRVWALDQLGIMTDDGDSREALATVRALFSPEQWKTFRRGEPFTPNMQGLVHAAIMLTAETFADGHPTGMVLPKPPHLYHHFTFRLAMCHVIHLIELGFVDKG